MAISTRSLIDDEKNYSRWFWFSTGIVFLVDIFWLHPTTRYASLEQILERIFLSHPYSPLELIQQIVVVIMIWILISRKIAFLNHELFRKAFLILLCLVFIEEISWGQIFYRYQWPQVISPVMGPHIDLHNVMLGRADTADLIEAMAASFTCFLLAPIGIFRAFRKNIGIPELTLTPATFTMLAFAFLISPLSVIREVNEQDIIFENAIFASITVSLLAFTGMLRSDGGIYKSSKNVVLWVLCPLVWFKFFYLMTFGHFPLFQQWP